MDNVVQKEIGPSSKLNTHPHLLPKLRIPGVISPLPDRFPWRDT